MGKKKKKVIVRVHKILLTVALQNVRKLVLRLNIL